MIRGIILATILASTAPVWADGERCTQLYESMLAQTNADPESCIPTIPATEEFTQCVQPFDYGGARQASHVVMILDASGSMAGQLNGKSKMSAAKSEAAKFLNDLAPDLPVGLMVYGHKGNNQEAGKLASCEGIEMMIPIKQNRRDVSKKIKGLQPTGWTPMAAALAFAEQEFGNLKPPKEGETSVPVVYLVSDGEETCGGDPVAAAKSLHQSGVKATVNVIGFDVDAETRAQLEAISTAGGGQFFPAKDAKALRQHLNAATAAERSHTDYKTCIFNNQGKAIRPYNQALLSFPACINRQTERNFGSALRAEVKKLSAQDQADCGLELALRIGREQREMAAPLIAQYEKLVDDSLVAREAARQHSITNALPPTQ